MSAPIIFAKHRLGNVPEKNHYNLAQDFAVFDFSGFETTPFLNQVLGLNLNKLMAPGLGLQAHHEDQFSFAVYYFSETAYRFIVSQHTANLLIALIEKHHNEYDIELVKRADLQVTELAGESAFDTLLSAFELTPGLRISDEKACYGKQSGDVFITTLVTDGAQTYQLVANQDTSEQWQATLAQQGFELAS